MVNTRRNVKKERERQEREVKQADVDKTGGQQPKEESTDKNSKEDVKEFDKTSVAPEPEEGTSKIHLKPAEKEPPHPTGSRCSNGSKSKKSPSFKSTLLDERKNLKIKAAEELARIQSDLVQKKLAASLAALEEKYSHISSSKSSEKNDNGSEIEKWIDEGQQVLQQARETGDVIVRPPAPAAVDSEATVSMLAQALKDLTASTCKQNNNLISRLSTPRELPTFSGDAMEWLNFKQSFDESTELCNYSAKENMWRLRKCLVGAAREAVSALLTSGSSPDTIMATLELQFGNPELIIHKIMTDIKKLSSLPQDYIGDIVKFSIKIKNFMAAVKTLNRDEYLKGVSICTIILSKLPTALLTKWSDYYHKQKDIQRDSKLTKLELLSQFLSEEATKITESGICLLNTKQLSNNADKSGFKQHAVFTASQQTEKCKFCKISHHSLINCRLFKKSLRKERWNYVRNNGICFKCLSADHDKETCSAPMCDKDGCGQPHHALLHYPINKQAPKQVHTLDVVAADDLDQMEPEEDSQPESEPASETGTVANVSDNNKTVFLKVVRVNIHGPKGVFTTHALLDDGAAVSLISENVINRVGLTGKSQTLRLRGAWNSGEIMCKSELIDFKISNENNECFDLRARKIAELNIPEQKLSKINIKNYEHLSELKDYNYESADVKPELLIGQDHYHLIMPIKIISRKRNEPCATLSALGWCVHGPITSSMHRSAAECILTASHSRAPAPRSASLPLGKLGMLRKTDNAGRLAARAHADSVDPRAHLTPPSPSPALASTSTSPELSMTAATCFDECSVLFIDASEPTDNYNEDVLLHETVRNYFNLESTGLTSKKRENKEEQRAISILNDTAKLKNGRWEVGLPWKNEEKLVESYSTAEKRLKSVEKRLRSNEEYASRYSDRIKHLFHNDYAREVRPNENGNRIWFIPHFGVDNLRKKKLRLVFDCASISHGKCLNDYLLQGPDLLSSLYGIMLRFRESQIGITGDIRDMFLRIKIRDEDQNALRFLWRENQAQPIKQFAMTSLLFGGNCSPFIAQFIRDKNAQQFIETKPNAVRAIMHSHYVDDFIDSLPTESEAINIIDDVSTVHKCGGFEIRGWTSNNRNVLSHLPKDQLSTNGESLLVDGVNKTQRTLGLLWDPAKDTLAVDVSFKNIPEDILEFKKTPTKREVLRITMSIYDIFGILAPITIKGKILLKSIWKTGLSWDDEITKELFIEFQHWITDLKSVVHLNIPRWYFIASTTTKSITSAKETGSVLELHLFSDAAPTAFAAVAYWRLVNANGDVCVTFIACKNRVSSMKRLSIPRSELESGLIAARLAKTIKDEHRIKCDRTYFWTDSSCLIHWVRNHNRNYKEYIANRLGEIDELTSSLEWRYVPSHLNIADIATKKTQYTLRADCEWFKGPAFLYQKEDQWPKDILTPEINKDDLEIAMMVQHEAINLDIPEPERFSSWIRLVRATAAVLKFTDKIRKIDVCEAITLARAERLILRYSQLQSFVAEITLLRKDKTLDKNSLPALLTLAPYLDEDGLMRVGGRIDAAVDIAPEMKRPIILDGRNYVTRLIVKFYHENAAHGHQEMVVNELKQKYWIIRIRPTVKHVTARCMFCRIQKAQPEIPRMGELPEARMAHHQRPFSNTGLDLFGPMDITVGRRREKRYVVLFTCLTIRAVHIELVHSLSTDSLILALRRMAARRGWPKQLFSDNGTNLRGANTEIKLAAEELDKSLLTTYAANRGVTWNFVPPASPHMAGAWERIIRSIKTTLKVTLKERAPREEVLLTLLAEAENMANSKPLTHVTVEPNYPEGLTPNHFLLGSSSNLPLMGSFDDSDFFMKRQWRISQRLADMYWSRWVKEVLPTMLPRQKWHDECRALQVGDLVLIVDPNAPRNHWARGLVQEVCPGKDGRVRAVHVKTKSRVLVRPAARIVRLPV